MLVKSEDKTETKRNVKYKILDEFADFTPVGVLTTQTAALMFASLHDAQQSNNAQNKSLYYALKSVNLSIIRKLIDYSVANKLFKCI